MRLASFFEYVSCVCAQRYVRRSRTVSARAKKRSRSVEFAAPLPSEYERWSRKARFSVASSIPVRSSSMRRFPERGSTAGVVAGGGGSLWWAFVLMEESLHDLHV